MVATSYRKLSLVTATAPGLTRSIRKYLPGSSLIAANHKFFGCGEHWINIPKSLAGKKTWVVHQIRTGKESYSQDMMALFRLLGTLKRAETEEVNLILPLWPDGRQERKDRPRVPISAADNAQILENVFGIKRLVTLDLHAPAIEGFFQTAKVNHITARSLFARFFNYTYIPNLIRDQQILVKSKKDIVLAPPDLGRQKFVFKLANEVFGPMEEGSIPIFQKTKNPVGKITNVTLYGSVKGKWVILVDDMIDSGGTMLKAAYHAIEKGALGISFAAVHGVCSSDALRKLSEPNFVHQITLTDSVPILPEQLTPKVNILPIGKLLAEVISRRHTGKSLKGYEAIEQ